VLAEASAAGRALGDGDPRRDGSRLPPEVAHDRGREAPVSIQRPDEALDVHDLRPQLDDEQRPAGRVPGEEVDDSAFAPDGERALRNDVPAGRGEDPGHQRVHDRVTRVQEVVEIRAGPPKDRVDVSAQGVRDRHERADLDGREVSPFDRVTTEQPMCDRAETSAWRSPD